MLGILRLGSRDSGFSRLGIWGLRVWTWGSLRGSLKTWLSGCYIRSKANLS